MPRLLHSVVAVAMVLGGSATLRADLRISESVASTVKDRTIQAVRSTHIKGIRMRLEQVQGDRSSVTLYDLPGGTMAELDYKKKRAQIRDIATRHAQLEKEFPHEQVTVDVAPTGATKTLAGLPCEEYAFAIKVPLTKDRETALSLIGAAWIAKSAPGADDYRTFVQAAIESQLVIGFASDDALALAVTRAQTEMYRALGTAPGIPYLIETAMKVDGKGMFAGMLNKVASVKRTSTVTNVAVEPLADAAFAIPDDWKREKK